MTETCQLCQDTELSTKTFSKLEEWAEGDDLIICQHCMLDCKSKAKVHVKAQIKSVFLVSIAWQQEDVEPITEPDDVDESLDENEDE